MSGKPSSLNSPQSVVEVESRREDESGVVDAETRAKDQVETSREEEKHNGHDK